MTEKKQTGLTIEKPGTLKRSSDAVPELLPADEQKEKAIIEAESKKKELEINNKESAMKADPEMLHTPDPQEKMEGPISSIMQTIKEVGESNDVVSKDDANKKKD